MGPTTCSSPPCALFLVLHGWTMDDDSMHGITKMNNKVASHGGAVVAYLIDEFGQRGERHRR